MVLNMISKIPCCDKENCPRNLHFRNSMNSLEDACAEKMKMSLCKNEFECCDTVKLFLEQVPQELDMAKTGIRYEYQIKDSYGNVFEVTIDKINISERYIQLKKYHFDIAPLVSGNVELSCILDYDKLPDMDKLKQVGFDTFPTFHETHFEVIHKENNCLHLRFTGGFHPLVTDIKMEGIFEEKICMENNLDPYDYFADKQRHGIGEVQFETIDNFYIVRIFDNYISSEILGWYEGISQEEIEKLIADPHNIKEQKHTNEYSIYCTDISFEFKINND